MTDFDDSKKRRYSRTTKLMNYLSAAWCGLSLIAISAIITWSSSDSAVSSLSDSKDPAEIIGILTAAFLFAVIVLALGVASGRFLVRALPPALSGEARPGRSMSVALYASLFVGLYLYMVFLCFVLASLDKSGAEKYPQAILGFYLIATLALESVWASGVIGLLIRRHRRPRRFLEQPFVLFLRRFSTFSDRAVIALILKLAPYGVPVVFLTPTHSRPGDWDVNLVGFSGLKLWHPWRSAPIVIRVKDNAWRGAAEELIQRAHTILLDISETSGALLTEAAMVDKAGRRSDTICLRLLVPGKAPVGSLSGARTIDYNKSWLRALPRMALGLLIVFFVALISYFPLAILFGGPFPSLLTCLAGAAAYYYSIFVRPAINREAATALRTMLRASGRA